jgi:hypothetical protein
MCAAVTTTALAVGMAGYQIYQGEKQKKDAKRALKNYERQDLDNAFEEVQISTAGSDYLREESQRTAAELTTAVREGGTRSILGGIPKIAATVNDANREGRAYLDKQYINRDYAIAGDKVQTRAMQETREANDLAGIGQAIMVGQQNAWNGIRGLGASLNYGARNIDFGEGSYNDRQREKDYKYLNGY